MGNFLNLGRKELQNFKKRPMKHLFVIATASSGKIRDFAHILGTDHYEFKTLKDIGFDEEIIEDGKSFAENAIIKSSTTARWLAKRGIEATVLADDSGLEVFALNGEPGIYSARYSGGHGNDDENNNLLLKSSKGLPTARHATFAPSPTRPSPRMPAGTSPSANPSYSKANAAAKSTTPP